MGSCVTTPLGVWCVGHEGPAACGTSSALKFAPAPFVTELGMPMVPWIGLFDVQQRTELARYFQHL
jgi:hypothetical protein